MKFAIEQLKAVMDSVRDNPELKPTKDANGNLTTHCNEAAYRIVKALALNFFYDETGKRILCANEIFDFMISHPENFSRFKVHLTARELSDKGYLIFAAQKGDVHGHIAPVYPGSGLETSGKWLAQVPRLSNVGVVNTIQGANYCFATPPDYFLVI